MLERMWLIRAFEERASELYARGPDRGPAPPRASARKAVAVGAMAGALEPRDRRLRRPPGACPRPGQGRRSRPAAGRDWRAGHRLLRRQGRLDAHRRARGRVRDRHRRRRRQHPAGPRRRAGRPRSDGSARVAVVVFGDGAGQAGSFHEIAQHRVACGACRSCSCARTTATRSSRRCPPTPRWSASRAYAETYGIPASTTVDGNDVFAVHAVLAARRSPGPVPAAGPPSWRR